MCAVITQLQQFVTIQQSKTELVVWSLVSIYIGL